MNSTEFLNTALDAGAAKAEIIESSGVVVSESFRDICKSNACGHYGRKWSCPPDIGEIGELMKELKKYSYVLIYQTIYKLEDSFDIEGMEEAGRLHSEVGQTIQKYLNLSAKTDFLHVSGSCCLCGKCAKLTGEPCRFPDKMLPSLSAYGIDVYRTCSNTSLNYINGQDTVTYFGMVFFR